jgi:hypothetical protein
MDRSYQGRLYRTISAIIATSTSKTFLSSIPPQPNNSKHRGIDAFEYMLHKVVVSDLAGSADNQVQISHPNKPLHELFKAENDLDTKFVRYLATILALHQHTTQPFLYDLTDPLPLFDELYSVSTRAQDAMKPLEHDIVFLAECCLEGCRT